MRDPRSTRIVASAAVVVALATTGCGDLAETIAEEAIERESGEEVELDFDSENGEIRVESGDGSFELTTDEDGSIRITGEDGEDSFEATADSDGNVEITGDDGETGETTSIDASAELPEGLPDDVPLPPGTPVQGIRSEDADGSSFVIIYTSSERSIGDLADGYRTALEAAGFVVGFESTGVGTATFQMERADWLVSFSGAEDDGEAGYQVMILPNG